ncbi:alpha/beta fold hydrolase [Janibacter sp. Y6]|uniref:esterase/lipase family protein n=1 Tax=Janibacter sp. Y6 TaxID=2913552 RepID=UPI0034A54016
MEPQPRLVTHEPSTPPTPGVLGSYVVERARALASPHAVLGSMVEAMWGLSHLAVYPLGALAPRRGGAGHRYRMEHLTPLQRGMVVSGVAESGTPILLIHGMVDNHSIFALLRRGLQRRGFSRVYSMNYSVRTSDVRTAAAQLAAEIEQICEETGYERIHVVAHSLGGLIARYYVTRLGGDDRVHTVVTLGSPHQGTHMARLLPLRIARQLRPGSPLFEELDRPAPGCTTRFVCFWSDTDEAVLPAHHAQLRHPDLAVTDVPLTGVGHLSLPILPSVAHRISTTLTQLDNDGAPTASVTSITPA